MDGVCSNWGRDLNVRRGLDAEAAREEAAVKRPARKSLISAHPTRFSTRVQIEQMFHGVLSIVVVGVKRRRSLLAFDQAQRIAVEPDFAFLSAQFANEINL